MFFLLAPRTSFSLLSCNLLLLYQKLHRLYNSTYHKYNTHNRLLRRSNAAPMLALLLNLALHPQPDLDATLY
jgi:hypothetical protein